MSLPITTQVAMPSVRDFGAVGDGKHDDTAAFQLALDSLVQPKTPQTWTACGGSIYIPPGRFKITGTIDITANNTCLLGGSGPAYDGRNTWLEFHGDVPMFRFPPSTYQTASGFSASGFVMVGHGRENSVAFSIETGNRFRDDLLFDRVGIYHFDKAIEVVKNGTQTQIANLTIEKCKAQWNRQVIHFGALTSCNILRVVNNIFTNNKTKLPSLPTMRIRAFGADVHGNNLEGQEDAVLFKYSEDVNVSGNQARPRRHPDSTCIPASCPARANPGSNNI